MSRIQVLGVISGLSLLLTLCTHQGVAARPSGELKLIDPAHPVLPNMAVTAFSEFGDTLYVAGRYIAPVQGSLSAIPFRLAGGAWAVSRDHGAHWTEYVSSTKPQQGALGGNIMPWRNHRRLPIDFTPTAFTVDPYNPRELFIAGCSSDTLVCVGPTVGHLLLRSRDGGATWADVLTYIRAPRTRVSTQTITTNIVKSPALIAVLQHKAATPFAAYSIAIDPHNSTHLYACLAGLGVIRSLDGARTWRYAPQPLRTKGCDIVVDSSDTKTVYSADTAGILYRSVDAGAHWRELSRLGRTTLDPYEYRMTDLVLRGHDLYVTVAQGVFRRLKDHIHWSQILGVPFKRGYLVASIRGHGGWIGVAANETESVPEGIYLADDHGSWRLGAYTDLIGQPGLRSLDMGTLLVGNGNRVWEDSVARIVFTSSYAGGLYRWKSPL